MAKKQAPIDEETYKSPIVATTIVQIVDEGGVQETIGIVASPDKQHLLFGDSNQLLGPDGDYHFRISRVAAAELIPYLKRFFETGSL